MMRTIDWLTLLDLTESSRALAERLLEDGPVTRGSEDALIPRWQRLTGWTNFLRGKLGASEPVRLPCHLLPRGAGMDLQFRKYLGGR